MEQQQKPKQGQGRPQENQTLTVGELLRAYLNGGREKLTQMLPDAEDGNKSIDLMQRSMEDPQHTLWVNKVQEAYYKKARTLASAAALFLDDYSQGIEEMVNRGAEDNPYIREHWNELQSLYRSYRQKQNELLLAVAYPITGMQDR